MKGDKLMRNILEVLMSITIYHNPRCSKSRQTLALIEEKGITPNIIKYLDQGPDAKTLAQIIQQLGLNNAHDLLRTKEEENKLAGLSPDSDDATVIAAMVKYPRLIERPIVVKGDKAVIGRPPESVLELL